MCTKEGDGTSERHAICAAVPEIFFRVWHEWPRGWKKGLGKFESKLCLKHADKFGNPSALHARRTDAESENVTKGLLKAEKL